MTRTNEFFYAIQSEYPDIAVEAWVSETSIGTTHYEIGVYIPQLVEQNITGEDLENYMEDGLAAILHCKKVGMGFGDTFEEAVNNLLADLDEMGLNVY